MTAKHTPGPWKVFEHSWCETSITAPDTPNAICGLDINHATEESQESDEAQMAANARLIAAAPELLEALEDAADQARHPDYDWPLWLSQKVSASIAKAKGWKK